MDTQDAWVEKFACFCAKDCPNVEFLKHIFMTTALGIIDATHEGQGQNVALEHLLYARDIAIQEVKHELGKES